MDDLFYFNIVLPHGPRSSHFLFCMVSEAVSWIFSDRTGSVDLVNHMDDFFIIGSARSGRCAFFVEKFVKICFELCVLLAADIAEGPSTVLCFLVIEINTLT